MIIRGGKSVAASFHFFGLLPHRSQPSGWNHSASPVQEVSPMVVVLAQIVAIMLGRFVFMLYSGYMVGFLLLGYIYIYIVIELYSYILIYLYRHFAIYLLFYCMLEAWGYCFLYIYILFLFLTSTSIFYNRGCRLSIIWLFTVQRYGGSVRYQTPGDALFG